MDYKSFFLWLMTIALINVASADISKTDNELANDVHEKIKNINPSVISQHPETIKWKQRCIETAGEAAFRKIKRASSKMVSCLTSQIKIKTIQREVNASIDNGDLDSVFKKYCGKKDKIIECIEKFVDTIELCTNDNEKNSLNITRELINAGIDFTCHDDGDRIAIFMSEKGFECFQEHMDEIKLCIQKEVPKLKDFDPKDMMDTIDPDDLGIDEERCEDVSKIHKCVVSATEKCSDPTPANVLDALFIQMRKVTPCAYNTLVETSTYVQAHAPPTFHLSHSIPLILTLITAALTAANILI